MILNHIFLLLILASLVIIPYRFYGKKKSVRFTVRMMYSEKARLFLSSLLGVLVCVFHMVYYSIHPLEKGLLISSLYVFFCFMSKKNMKILMQVRKSQFAILLLSLVAVGLAYVPQMFSCSATLAFIIMFACLFPPKTKKWKSKGYFSPKMSEIIEETLDKIDEENLKEGNKNKHIRETN